MILLLIFALSRVLVAQPGDIVEVHEWGVIELDQEFQAATGAAHGYIDGDGNLQPMEIYEVEAPVVWFHGAACSGTLIVTANTGWITTAVPWYDGVLVTEETPEDGPGSQTVSWIDLSVSQVDAVSGATEDYPEEEEVEQIGMWDGFEYAVPYWQSVEANTLNHPSSGYSDTFLYYECSFRDMDTYSDELHGYQGTYLIFFMEDSDLTCVSAATALEVDARGAVLTEQDIIDTFLYWSDSSLEVSEVQALWDTWKPAIRYRCDQERQTVMVFPLSEEQTEAICTIEFQPDGDQQVQYSRLFLGMGRI